MIDREFVKWNTEYPLAVIGDAVMDYIKYYDGVIVSVRDAEELKEKIAYYSGMSEIGRVLVIEDISFIGDVANKILLKFVEESEIPLVLLSRYDKFDDVLLSRVRKVVKYYKSKTESEFQSVNTGYNVLEDRLSADTSYYDRMRYIAKTSPKIYMLENLMTNKIVKNRIKNFM